MAEKKRLEEEEAQRKDEEAQRKEDEMIKRQNEEIDAAQTANLLTLMNAEEHKGNSQTTYKKKGGRPIGSRMKNVKYEPDAEDEFTNRFGDYLGSGRAGGMSMRSGSISQAPKLSMHKKKHSIFGKGKMSIH